MKPGHAIAAITVLALTALTPMSVHAAEGYRCVLDGAQQSPNPVVTPAMGIGTFILNDAATQLEYHIEYSGLLGTETASHFHTITNGPCPTGFGGVTFGVGGNIGLQGGTKQGVWNIPAASVTQLRNGCIYFNIHTSLFPGGEIRGNIFRDDAVQVNASTWGRVKVIYR